MAASIGRLLVVKKNSVVIAGLKEKSMTPAAEGVDITSDDDSGFRTFLSSAGVRMIDVSFSGVTKDDILTGLLTNEATTDFILTDITIEYPGAVSTDIISGDFYFGNIELTGATNDSLNFSGTMQSSGAWTRTVGV